MRVHIVPFSEVSSDVDEVKRQKDTSNPSSRSQKFNTAQHHRHEILPIVPEHTHFKHEVPSWEPYDYTLWLPVIAESQELTESDCFIGRIPGFMCEDLLRCHSAWVTTSQISQTLLDDAVETWMATPSGKSMAKLFDGRRPWFVRLAQMSPKDSPLGGKVPSTTLRHVIMKLCSSMRAYGCIQKEVEDARQDGRDIDLKIVVNRWDSEMDSAKEFRVFVPPPLARLRDRTLDVLDVNADFQISAISQYRWPEPFQEVYPGLRLEDTAHLVRDHANAILERILKFIDKKIEVHIKTMLLTYGFCFDVVVKEAGQVQLVEINPFGALSGCGACLFNWIKDGKTLYGLQEAQFIFTLE